MLHTLWIVAWFIVALIILVAVHEFGHFWIARLLGVKVLRYSIGFGKVLFSWRDRKQTQYAISAIPLGGYVKMLDEREGPVAPAELPYAFNRKPLYARAAIVLAGPLFNILFAVIAYWLMYCIGMTDIVPVIKDVSVDSIAARAGLSAQHEIVEIAGKPVHSWTDVRLSIVRELGSHAKIPVTTRSLTDQVQQTLYLNVQGWEVEGPDLDIVNSLGIHPDLPHILPVVDIVLPDTPAAIAGLRVGDRILALNGEAVKTWEGLVSNIANHPRKDIILSVSREQQEITIPLKLGEMRVNGKTVGYLGIKPEPIKWPSYLLHDVRYQPLEAIVPAIKTTWNLFILSWRMLGKMLVGHLSFGSVSGPIGIAQAAGYSASLGLSYFLNFLALISLSLAMVNLLPIPLLDGGHLLYYLIEAFTRKPVSEHIQALGIRIGVIFLLAVMLLAFYNDISRW